MPEAQETDPPMPEQSSDDSPKPPDAKKARVRQTVKNELKKLKIEYANFGIVEGRDTHPPTATGPRKAADVKAELASFVPPDCFLPCVDRLKKDRLLVLTGQLGTGKRTSALALLREVAPGDLLQLSPAVTLEELRTYEYEAGVGYLVIDHTVHEQGAEAEFRWDTLRSAVRDAGAFLVVTTTRTVPHVPSAAWSRPNLVTLFTQLLESLDNAADLAETLASRVPDDWTLTNSVECVRRVLADPDHPESSLEVFDLATIAEVQTWFDDDGRDWLDFIEVCVLVFASGAGERRFESYVGDLEAALAVQMPVDDTSDEAKARAAIEARSRRRKRRVGGLVQVERLLEDGTPRQVLAFRSPRHRLHVLNELWASYRTPFWNGLRGWLNDLVEHHRLRDDELLQVSQGVALLAQVNLEEAVTSYLRPWASGEFGVDAMTCTAGALRFMSLDDATAPIALQIAVDWVNRGDLPERITAQEALMTEVGGRFPAEAARRLWQLIVQDDQLAGIALDGPAGLLVHLVECGIDASDLLGVLEQQLVRLAKPRCELKMVDLTLGTVLRALSAHSLETNRLASFDLIADQTESAPSLARLWAGVLANRRYRADALAAIWDGLRTSPNRSLVGPTLGDAFAEALTPAERASFIRDWTTIDSRKRQRDKTNADSLAHLIIDALERMRGHAVPEE